MRCVLHDLSPRTWPALWRGLFPTATDAPAALSGAESQPRINLPGLTAALSGPWRRRRFGSSGEDDAELRQARLQAAVDGSVHGFGIFTPVVDGSGSTVDFQCEYLNEAAERLLRLRGSPGAGMSLRRTMALDSGERFFHQCCGVLHTGAPHTEEKETGFHEVAAGWLRYRVIRLDRGAIGISLTDTSSAHTEEKRYKELAEFTDSIFKSAPCGIVVTDVDGVISSLNPATEVLTGYSREDLIGKASLTLFYDRHELQARAREGALPILGAGDGFEILTASDRSSTDHDWTFVRRDGSRLPVNVELRTVTSDSGEVTGWVGIIFDVTDRRAMMDYVTHLATHDQLTGLVGRAVLQERIVHAVERARRYGTKVAIFTLDLDQFKRINDSLGHWAGDQVLLETASRLRQTVRSSDTVARMGGDEFVVVMEDITTMADVENCAANLVTRFAPEMLVEGHQLHVTASVGVCVFPDFAGDARHLLKWADAAMYSAKENGRNQHQVFNEGMLRETADRLSMERALRHAIANNELRLYYQPQVSLTTGEVVGMEALLRWQHPNLGLLAPAQFITLAEDTGLILAIGEWAFVKACCQGTDLRNELGMDLTVSVNLSPKQFQQKNLVAMVEQALKQSQLPARSLEIEITENTLMVNSAGTLEKLQRIRELGVRIAIDDFGTGFCNFKYLLEYEVDRLKIDQTFVRLSSTDANAAAVVRTIIAMSHGLGIKVVAEGVETEEHVRFLVRRRCDEAQGYFFSRPIPPDEFAATVRSCNVLDLLESA